MFINCKKLFSPIRKIPIKDMAEVKVFHWADYVVFVISLIVSAIIGIYYEVLGKKNYSVGEFLMGYRKMNILPVALSMQATFVSAIFVLGVPAEVYTYGSLFLVNIIGSILAVPIITHLFVPICTEDITL